MSAAAALRAGLHGTHPSVTQRRVHRAFSSGPPSRHRLPPPPALRRQTSESTKPTECDPDQLAFLTSIGLDAPQADHILSAASKRKTLTLPAITAVCTTLVDDIGIPLTRLGPVLHEQPELLSYTPHLLREQWRSLQAAWPSAHQLKAAVIMHPAMLRPAVFNAALRRAMDQLQGLGLTREQVGRILTARPQLTELTAGELARVLQHTGLDLGIPAARTLIAAHPDCLLPEGAAELRAVFGLLKKQGLKQETKVKVVAACPGVLTLPVADVKAVVAALHEYGLDKEQLNGVITGYPPVLVVDSRKIVQTLGLMRALKITPARLAAYPRAFAHHPGKVIGPRMAYLRQYWPEDYVALRLSTILSRSDEHFMARRGPCLKHYYDFKGRWLEKYGTEFGIFDF
jgi:hypothetical protein